MLGLRRKRMSLTVVLATIWFTTWIKISHDTTRLPGQVGDVRRVLRGVLALAPLEV